MNWGQESEIHVLVETFGGENLSGTDSQEASENETPRQQAGTACSTKTCISLSVIIHNITS